jgi:hypothetical protein
MDLYPGHDMYDSFCSYQAALLTEFDRMSSEFNFEMVDASPDAKTVCEHLKKNILHLLERDSRRSFVARLYAEPGKDLAGGFDKMTAAPVRSGLRSASFPSAIASPASNGHGHHSFHQK